MKTKVTVVVLGVAAVGHTQNVRRGRNKMTGRYKNRINNCMVEHVEPSSHVMLSMCNFCKGRMLIGPLVSPRSYNTFGHRRWTSGTEFSFSSSSSTSCLTVRHGVGVYD